MRNDDKLLTPQADGVRREVAHDEKTFFESYYRSTVRPGTTPEDRQTIGGVAELESRFHYNAVENAIIRCVLHRTPPPRGMAVETWRLLQRRADLRHLDIGSGTGHWIDFFRNVLLVSGSVAVEIVPQMAEFLTQKYANAPGVTVFNTDAAGEDFGPDLIGGEVDFVSAIGVMFHIVDDTRWARAFAGLARSLKPGGLMFLGGDFGAETRNTQFHNEDRFGSWREFHHQPPGAEELRVNKRVRALTTWVTEAARLGLEVVDLVRADRDYAITTPENDILLLRKPD
jgi:SAM-dependent methyltransferase